MDGPIEMVAEMARAEEAVVEQERLTTRRPLQPLIKALLVGQLRTVTVEVDRPI